jgi:UDP-glucose 4-epimerase
MHILVTGGAGYIGSHTIIELLTNGYDVTVIDNFINSSRESLRRVEKITGKTVAFHQFDLRDADALERLFADSSFSAVIHFAGLKSVSESVERPLDYFSCNIDSSLALLRAMERHNVTKLIFSSSATVYGSAPIPYKETDIVGQGITNPYGDTKYIIEQILTRVAQTNQDFEFTALRYFNPIGAHPSGLIGEQPKGIPDNLMPYITQVATKKREFLSIFGDDYPTLDGTAVRDYIHVCDLATGHVAALNHHSKGFSAFNLGSGKGTSVLELVHAFTAATDINIPYKIAARRDGDLPEYYADVSKAQDILHWHAEKSIQDACADSWRWQSHNPNGYEESI